MSTTGCDRERAILEAVASGVWSGALRDHAASCEHCAETAFVAHHLHAEAAELDRRPLPDPRLILQRSRIEDRFLAVHRATRLITVMHGIAAAFAGAFALAVLAWLLPAVRAAVSSAFTTLTSTSASGGGASPGLVLLASFLVILTMVLSEVWQGRLEG